MINLTKLPLFGDRGSHVEILQELLKNLGFDIGNIDGDFGEKTRTAIKNYQSSKGLSSTGKVTTETLQSMNVAILDHPDPDNQINGIIYLVDTSDIEKLNWKNRGRAPYGFYYGMAILFAKMYSRLQREDSIIQEISKPLSNFEKLDALTKYRDLFDSKTLSLIQESDRLRCLYTLMFGLGMMESSGRFCCGWDRGKINGWGNKEKIILPSATNSEAGLFQTSFDVISSINSSNGKSLLKEVINNYSVKNQSLVEYFSKGVKINEKDEENYGDGPGKDFQELSKHNPAFAVEFAALALRNVTGHWNPVIKKNDSKKGLEIKKECYELLQKIQNYIDGYDFDNVEVTSKPLTPLAILTDIPNRDTLKENLLDKANLLGQREKLNEMFNRASNSKANFWAIVDFNKPSSEERLFIFDLLKCSVKKYIVTHGKNSGELYATTFSNDFDSNKSSIGLFQTGAEYKGKHGRSLFLEGLDSTNDNALERYIVIHQADYAVPNYDGTGRAGRSLGCFAVHASAINEVVESLKDGSYILAWHS